MEEFWLNPGVLFLFFLLGLFLAGFIRGFLEAVGAIESRVAKKDKEENERQRRIDALYGRAQPDDELRKR
jgi:hypothetical protein